MQKSRKPRSYSSLPARCRNLLLILGMLLALTTNAVAERLKSIARLSGLQENTITGYGLVIGLAGTGDSRRNKDTTQAISNLLQTFGVTLSPHDINSRNSATVIISANLPAHAHQGDKIDVNVASMGDAKSLLGGTLLVTPMKGADNFVYALAQGPVSIGGFKYDLYGNVIQKNHPTTGIVPSGAVVEKTLYNDTLDKTGDIHMILNRPDYSTANAVEIAINQQFGKETAIARSAQDIEIHPPVSARTHFVHFVSALENIRIKPDGLPTVVINERTGVVVAGANVTLDAVSISYGNLQITIATDYAVSQPSLIQNMGKQVQTTVTPVTNASVKEDLANTLRLPPGSTIADLVATLTKSHTTTRDLISILETLQRAGALHAELIIQ